MEILANVLSGLVGGALALVGVWLQNNKQDKDTHQELENNIVSLIDIHLYKIAQTRNIELNKNKTRANRKESSEAFYDVRNNFEEIDNQIQELMSLLRIHSKNSNECVQDLLKRYQPLNQQLNRFTRAHSMYVNLFEDKTFDRDNLAKSKRNLDKELKDYIDKMRNFSLKYFNHQIFEYPLKDLED